MKAIERAVVYYAGRRTHLVQEINIGTVHYINNSEIYNILIGVQSLITKVIFNRVPP